MAKSKVRDRFSKVKVTVEEVEAVVPTMQEFKDQCNINYIMKRWQAGIAPPAWMTSKTPHYGDFSDLPVSFDEAHRIMQLGEEAFNALPLAMRHELDHDPRNLDNAPIELFEKYGLVKKPVGQTSGTPEAGKPVGQRSGDLRSPKPPKGGVNEPSGDSDKGDEA